MFGIKTKKDKRIEELESMCKSLYFKHPHIIESMKNGTTIAATVVMEDLARNNVPIECYKREIRCKLAECLENFIRYDIVDDEYTGKKILKAYLVVGR